MTRDINDAGYEFDALEDGPREQASELWQDRTSLKQSMSLMYMVT